MNVQCNLSPFCGRYHNLQVREIKSQCLIPQIYVDEIQHEIQKFLSSRDMIWITLGYLQDPAERIFDNWVEIPRDQDEIQAFIYQNDHILTTYLDQNDTKRIALKTPNPRMKCSMIPCEQQSEVDADRT